MYGCLPAWLSGYLHAWCIASRRGSWIPGTGTPDSCARLLVLQPSLPRLIVIHLAGLAASQSLSCLLVKDLVYTFGETVQT